MDRTEKRRKFIINVIYWGILAAVIILFIRRFLGVLTPFLVAFAVSWLLRPLWTWISKKTRLPVRGAAILTVLLFYALLVTLLVLLANTLIGVIKDVAADLPALYTDFIAPAVTNLAGLLRSFLEDLPGLGESNINYDTVLSEILSSLGSIASGLSGRLLAWATSLISDVPGFLLRILIAIIASLFTAADFPRIKAFIKAQLPEKARDTMQRVRDHFGKVMRSYLRSYLIIMGITFLEVFLGTLLIGYSNAFFIAIGIALVDILPILGSGTILIPWGVINLLTGNTVRGVALLVLYLIIAAIRNYIEPRIIGKHVGLHPLLTLMSMVIGTYVFGGIGLFGLPITLAVLKSLRDGGILRLYNDPPAELTE